MAQPPQRVRLIQPPGDRGPTAMFLRNAKIALLTDWRSLMANVEFTLEELEDLARKLQTLQPILSEEECVLLLAILRVVIDLTIGCRLATLTDLKQQLGNSYTPGGDIDSLTIGESTFYKICPPKP